MEAISAALPSPAISALREGDKVQAIKIVRQANGSGLKAAKDLVESYIAADSDLRAKFTASKARSIRAGLLMLAFVVALALLFLLRKA